MQSLQVINDNPVVNMIILIVLSCLSFSILIVAFVLCGDIYGAGPAFVAVTGGFGLCAFCGHLWYARQKNTADQYYNLNFGLSIILGVAALQQAVMFGGLGNDTFESRMLSLAADIINASKWTCAAGCIAYDINYTVYEISQMHQELDAEVAMSFFQSVMFLLMIPFSLAMYTAQGSTPSGGKQDSLDYADYSNSAAEASTAEYSDL